MRTQVDPILIRVRHPNLLHDLTNTPIKLNCLTSITQASILNSESLGHTIQQYFVVNNVKSRWQINEHQQHCFVQIDTSKWVIRNTHQESLCTIKLFMRILIHRKSLALPSHASKWSTEDDFANKIDVIRSGISYNVATNPDTDDGCLVSLCSFTSLSEDEVSKLIVSLSSATCDYDPVPTSLVKECLNVMLPTITRIMNLWLECGVFPSDLKSARVGSILKKPTRDPGES